jgi:hypothetical protein
LKPVTGAPNFEALGQAIERRGIAMPTRFRLASFSGETFGLQAAPFGQPMGAATAPNRWLRRGQRHLGRELQA